MAGKLRDVTPALRHGAIFLAILLAGTWLRVHDLEARPMHADEANQAVKVGQMLEGATYRFDPADHHGPTLYFLGRLAAQARGERSLAELTEVSVRLVPACFGSLAIVLLWRLLRPIGPWPALAGAALFALSPPAVYYSRYFIQETLLACFTLGAFLSGRRWWVGGDWRWAAVMGACAGLMQATKASALLFGIIAAVGVIVIDRRRARERGWRPWVVALAAAAATAGVFYSSFGANPGGLRDAFGTLAPMLGKAAGGATGHEKPWWYYGRLFLFARTGGYVWDQTLLVVLAAAGAFAAFRQPSRLPRWLAAFTLGSLLVLSLVPYKTPWIVVNLVPGVCALAACALARVGPVAALPLAGATLLLLGWQTRQAAFLRPADARNPFAYVHSSPDVRKVPALAAQMPAGPIKVISPEYWPLPWYLRQRPEVGYWSSPPEDCDAVLVITSAELAEEVRARLRGRYVTSFLGLRPGYVLVLFAAAE